MLSVSSKKTSKPAHKKEAPEPEKKKSGLWGPKSAIVVSIVTFALAQVAVFYIISLWFFGVLGRPWEQSSADWIYTITGQFAFVLLSEAIIMLTIWYFLKRRGVSFKELGFKRKPNWEDLGWALIGFVAYFILLLVVAGIVRELTTVNFDQRQDLGFESVATSPEKLMAFISLVLLPPIVEETVFRGFLFTGLRRKMTFIGATIVTSMLFAAPHLLGSNDGILWIAGIDTLVLSLVLCYLREKTGALWAPIMVHAVKNGIAFSLFLSYVAVT